MSQDKIMIKHLFDGKFGKVETETEINEALNTLYKNDFLIENFLRAGRNCALAKGEQTKLELYNTLIESMDINLGIPLDEPEVIDRIENNPDYKEVLEDYKLYKEANNG